MANQGNLVPSVEQLALKNHRVAFHVFFNANTTAASITGNTDAQVGITMYTAQNSTTAPSDASFPTIQDVTAPAVSGFYINCGGRAVRLRGCSVPVNSIRSASMTAGVVTNAGAAHAISGKTGVTTGGNIAFSISQTTLDGDTAAGVSEYDVECTFDTF